MTTETEIRTDMMKRYNAAFPAGRLVKVWAGHTIAKKGGHIDGAEPGTPDLCGYLPDGRFLGVEVKKPGGKTMKERAEKQAAFRDHSNRAGGVCVQVESWQELRAVVCDALKLPFE